MQYRYEAYNPRGERTRGRLEATSRDEAEAQLWEAELTVVSLKRQRQGMSLETVLPSFFGLKRHTITEFTRQLSTLLESGIPINVSLEMLQGQAPKAKLRDVLVDMQQALEEGTSFADACGRHPDIFPPMYVSMVHIGEETGSLDVALVRVADFIEKEDSAAGRVRRALTYPTLILAVAAFAILILVNFVIPSLTALFSEFGGELPLQTRILLQITAVLRAATPYILGLTTVSLIGGYVYLRRPEGKRSRDLLLLRLPLIGKIVRTSIFSRLGKSLAMLLGAGMSTLDALTLATETVQNTAIRDAMGRIRENATIGHSLAESFRSEQIFPSLVYQMIAVGEESGRLAHNMEATGSFYEKELDRAISSLTGSIEPALILVAGLVVGFIAISIITPIYSLINEIG